MKRKEREERGERKRERERERCCGRNDGMRIPHGMTERKLEREHGPWQGSRHEISYHMYTYHSRTTKQWVTCIWIRH
jgi:hypothetical protein